MALRGDRGRVLAAAVAGADGPAPGRAAANAGRGPAGAGVGVHVVWAAAAAGVSMTRRVGVVIPCYRAAGQVEPVVQEVLEVAQKLQGLCSLQIFVVNDGCPQLSWREIAAHPRDYLRLSDRQPSR